VNDNQLGSGWIQRTSKYGTLVEIQSSSSADIPKSAHKWIASKAANNNFVFNAYIHSNRKPSTKWSVTTLKSDNPEFKEIKNSYIAIKKYEKNTGIDSKEMFRKWKLGQIRGPQYSEWVDAYIKVWRSIE
jgi:hypothetical protein